jgi:hypothetical protein
MKRTGWIVFGAVAIGVVLCGCLVLALLIPGWFVTDSRFHGPGMGRMFGDCPWCGSGLGIGLGELLVILLALAAALVVVAAVILGVVWLIRSQGPSRQDETTLEE